MGLKVEHPFKWCTTSDWNWLS